MTQQIKVYGIVVVFIGFDKKAFRFDAIDAIERAVPKENRFDDAGNPISPFKYLRHKGFTKITYTRSKGFSFGTLDMT